MSDHDLDARCGYAVTDDDLRAHLAAVLAALVEQAKREAAAEAHDDRCESEYESGAHAWTPCGCSATRAEVEALVAEAREDGWRAAVEVVKSCPGGWINCACTPACGTFRKEVSRWLT